MREHAEALEPTVVRQWRPDGTTLVAFAIQPTREIIETIGVAEPFLSAPEISRRDSLRAPDLQDDFVASRWIARQVAAAVASRGVSSGDIRLSQCCPNCGGPHGPISVGMRSGECRSIHLSLSRTSGIVAAVASNRPCAIDLERANRPIGADFARRVLHPAEFAALLPPFRAPAFLARWVRLECVVKLGMFSLDGISRIDLTGVPTGTLTKRAIWRGHRICDLAGPDWVAAMMIADC